MMKRSRLPSMVWARYFLYSLYLIIPLYKTIEAIAKKPVMNMR